MSESARARALATLAGVFVAGLLGGAALDRAFGRVSASAPNVEHRTSEPPTSSSRRHGTGTEGIVGARAPLGFDGLDLTPRQEDDLRAIVSRLRPVTDSLWQIIRPKARAVELEMFRESVCVLTPAQIEQFKRTSLSAGATEGQVDERLALVTSGKCPPRDR